MEDIAWRTFIGFLICLLVATVVVSVTFLWLWLGWWLLIGIVLLFMALCVFYSVGHAVDVLNKE